MYTLLSEREQAIRTLDLKWARRAMPSAYNDEVRLAALHKARYERTDMERALRLESRDWLAAHGHNRINGRPLLPPGVLPK